eukprot:1142793-Amphidinium_carterae.1
MPEEEEDTLYEGLHSAKFIAPGHRFVRGDRVILSGFDAQTRHGYPANEATLLRAIGHERVVFSEYWSCMVLQLLESVKTK